jgi:hypothetical protein
VGQKAQPPVEILGDLISIRLNKLSFYADLVMNNGMRLGRVVLSFALALLWLGMPVHCQLESISAASLFACVDDKDCSAPSDGGCTDDFCGSVESGNYFPQKTVTLAKAPMTAVLFQLYPSPSLSTVPQERSAGSPEDTVPLLSTSWHFVQRVAAPPRAPTIIS